MSKTKHTVALIVDAACDVPPALVEQYNIILIHLYLIWGEEEIRSTDLSLPAFYDRLQNHPIHPKTSMPTVEDFIEKIEEAKQSGAREVVIMTTSREMSATIDSADRAKALVDIPIHTVDSRSGSMGFGWQVIAAARAREAGGDALAMIAAAYAIRPTLHFIFAVDTLEYLHKGGRIGGAAKWFGTMLQLKPLLYFDLNTGRIEPGERIRTRRKSLERTYEIFFDKMDTDKPMHIAVLHANVAEVAQEIAARIKEEYTPVELLVAEVSPTTSTHAGPGAVGIAGYYEA